MAVIGVTKEWKDMQGARIEGDETGLRENGTAGIYYLVKFDGSDDIEQREIQALTASYGGVSIPDLYAAHSSNTGWYVKSKFASPISPTIWRVEVVYEYIPDPLNQPPVYEWDFVVNQEPIGYGYKYNDYDTLVAITNSSGEPPDPPLMEDTYDLVVRVRRNTSSFSALTAKEYIGAVNADEIWSHPIHTVRCNYWKAQMRRAGSVNYFEEQLEFQFRYDLSPEGTYLGWWRKFPDMGFRTKASGQTVGTEILDESGQPISNPVLLDGSGGVLGEGLPTVYRYFLTKKIKTFSTVFNF